MLIANKVLARVLCLGLVLQPLQARSASQSELLEFSVQPNRCIALHQGQTCYQNLVFSWQTPTTGDYCLYEALLVQAMVCWTGNEINSYGIEFISDINIVYQIRQRDEREVLAEVMVEVAWVYKSSRKSFSRWRLF